VGSEHAVGGVSGKSCRARLLRPRTGALPVARRDLAGPVILIVSRASVFGEDASCIAYLDVVLPTPLLGRGHRVPSDGRPRGGSRHEVDERRGRP